MEEKLAKTAARNEKVYSSTLEALKSASFVNDGSQQTKNKCLLLYNAVIHPKLPLTNRNSLFLMIGDERIKTKAQLDAAIEFLVSIGEEKVEESILEQQAGVGVIVTKEDICERVKTVLDENHNQVQMKGSHTNVGLLVKQVLSSLRFADAKLVRLEVERQLQDLLNHLSLSDKTQEKPFEVKPLNRKEANKDEEENVDPFAGIPNIMAARDLETARNTPELLERHRLATGGKVICRFPPEPNGFLHIGHAKSMFLNFGYAQKENGICILRYDDTNPEAEREEFIKSIEESVKWLGYEPSKITFTSDYFDQLYELAVELIKRDKAYVCHLKPDEISQYREKKQDSPWRNRPIEESLTLFEDMKFGKFEEGAATLRMKIDMQHPNPCMQDPIAYRIRYKRHPHSGDRWCIYPSYDFAHCIVDSLEWITHSLCTLEFEIRRDSYYWLLAALDMYRPFVWEFSRLVVTHTVVSKRKLTFLVDKGYVRGWDDPRMPTLMGLRRRGFPPEALRKFCASVGVTRGDNLIGFHKLENACRTCLDPQVFRRMCVLEPLKVVIENLPKDHIEWLQVPNHPKDEGKGTHKSPFTKEVYIEKSDFRLQDEKDFFGLAPGKTVLLRYAYPITAKDIKWSAEDPCRIESVVVSYDPDKTQKPKGVLHWVASNQFSTSVEVRLYNNLFLSEQPGLIKGDAWLDDINPESEVVKENALLEYDAAQNIHPGDIFQFERLGFFCCDKDSTIPTRVVFNRTVTLKGIR
ncbi:Glutamine--tRNA ligase [Galdieria sulphuraria]|nr:Glutamine--tRNA ligase [Galdieria sulphuraria]